MIPENRQSMIRYIRTIALLILLPLSLVLSGQYLGGDGDGGISVLLTNTTLNNQLSYCSGGDGDGYGLVATAQATMNDQGFYCTGGNWDGFYALSDETTLNEQTFYCSGGNYDGYGMGYARLTVSDQPAYCSGGFGDGHDLDSREQTLNDQSLYCYGSSGDGHTMLLFDGSIYGNPVFVYGGDADGADLYTFSGNVYGQVVFCYGGDGDGYSLTTGTSLYLGIGVWTGLTSSGWTTGTNWQHSIVPGINDNVTIPAGCPHYPEITSTLAIDTAYGTFRCNGLEIRQSATLNTNSPVFIKGNMVVAGTYTATMNGNNANRICDGGYLNIKPAGTAVFGNQTTLWGLTDLLVYGGGELVIDSGTLHIDDQLHIYSGGSLNMTGGELWVHKFGYGTSYASSNPASLYIEPGAQGSISGGILRICGKTSPYGLYSMTILEPAFSFSVPAVVRFQHGVYDTHYDASINNATGVVLPDLVIDKTGNSVFVNGDLSVAGTLQVEPGSALNIQPGSTMEVGTGGKR